MNRSLPGIDHTIHVGTFRRDEIRMTTINSVLYHSDLFRIQRYSSITPINPKPCLSFFISIIKRLHPTNKDTLSTPLHLNHTFVPLPHPFSPIFSHHSLNHHSPPSPLHSILPAITSHPLTNPNHINSLTPSIHPSIHPYFNKKQTKIKNNNNNNNNNNRPLNNPHLIPAHVPPA